MIESDNRDSIWCAGVACVCREGMERRGEESNSKLDFGSRGRMN